MLFSRAGTSESLLSPRCLRQGAPVHLAEPGQRARDHQLDEPVSPGHAHVLAGAVVKHRLDLAPEKKAERKLFLTRERCSLVPVRTVYQTAGQQNAPDGQGGAEEEHAEVSLRDLQHDVERHDRRPPCGQHGVRAGVQVDQRPRVCPRENGIVRRTELGAPNSHLRQKLTGAPETGTAFYMRKLDREEKKKIGTKTVYCAFVETKNKQRSSVVKSPQQQQFADVVLVVRRRDHA